MGETDKRIPENIEREISFLQFSETMVRLIMDYKENVVSQKWSTVAPNEPEVGNDGKQKSVSGSKTEISETSDEPREIKSENLKKNISEISTRASGSLLQV